jgi:hypothetical protein
MFFGCWCCLVFVFVVILLLYFCCNFCIFIFILLFVVFYLPAMTWFDLEVEIVLWVLASIWLFAVSALQLSFYSDSCFTRIELFTEFLCNLHRLVRSWNRPGLLMVLFELLVNTIASCSVLLNRIQYLFLHLHCFLLFGPCCWGRPPLMFWVYCWGAHPIFVYRISHFFFLLDQKWERSFLVTISLFNLKKKNCNSPRLHCYENLTQYHLH